MLVKTPVLLNSLSNKDIGSLYVYIPSKVSEFMRTIQVQKVKVVRKRRIYSFSETCPRWVKQIHQSKTEEMKFYDNTSILDLADFKYCIVGEAHGFNRDYTNRGTKDYCDNCYHQAIVLASILTEGPKKREHMVDIFVNHWNSRHA